jgi:hypothetical protein
LTMPYIEEYQSLKSLFDPDKEEIQLPGNITLKNLIFHSAAFAEMAGQPGDSSISENIRFRYPVLLPNGIKKSGKAIILLHGLNERTWHKHLTSAKFMAEKTGKAVILFPLSFHINRGLPEWTDVRKLSIPLEARKLKFPGIKEATLINLALSERLTEFPQRFFLSGLQSTLDLVSLMKEIRDGQHPLFEKGSSIDLFAYSISCMLLQSLMINNPENILKNSRIVLFAGGSLLSQIQGVSRYIMDSLAYETLRDYYLKITGKKTGFLGDLQPWIMEHSYGIAFRSLISSGILKRNREKTVTDFSDNLMVIALHNDRIMPLDGIRQATGEKFSRSKNFKILDFQYAYTHENPFPVLNMRLGRLVEQAFLSVFRPTLNFLS